MGRRGYHTSFLKNLLLRVEKAAGGLLRFVDEKSQASLDIAVIVNMGPYLSDVYLDYDRPHWISISQSGASSANKRYMHILESLVRRPEGQDVRPILSASKALGFEFSSIEELNMKLTVMGY